jgi:hypothetical protein
MIDPPKYAISYTYDMAYFGAMASFVKDSK